MPRYDSLHATEATCIFCNCLCHRIKIPGISRKVVGRSTSASESRLHSYNSPLEGGLPNYQCYRPSNAYNITFSQYPDQQKPKNCPNGPIFIFQSFIQCYPSKFILGAFASLFTEISSKLSLCQDSM